LYHAINGIWSGISVCCVAYFVFEMWQGNQPVAEMAAERRGENTPTNYVVCDKCWRAGRFIKTKQNGTLLDFMFVGVEERVERCDQ
jgi:hypothetical protein